MKRLAILAFGDPASRLRWVADDGNIAGARRFHAFVGALLAVHAAFATLLSGLVVLPTHAHTFTA